MKRQKSVVWVVVGVLFFGGAAQAGVTAGTLDFPSVEVTWAGSALPDVMSVWKSQLVKTYRSPGLISSAKATNAGWSVSRHKVVFGLADWDQTSFVPPPGGQGFPTDINSSGCGFVNLSRFNQSSITCLRSAGRSSCYSRDCTQGNGTGTPVIPAPGAIALGAIGMTVVGWLRRRRVV